MRNLLFLLVTIAVVNSRIPPTDSYPCKCEPLKGDPVTYSYDKCTATFNCKGEHVFLIQTIATSTVEGLNTINTTSVNAWKVANDKSTLLACVGEGWRVSENGSVNHKGAEWVGCG